jgi:hypothetical protein
VVGFVGPSWLGWSVPALVPLSYWLHLGVEGSVVGLFELDRREVAERAVESAVVVPVDPSSFPTAAICGIRI